MFRLKFLEFLDRFRFCSTLTRFNEREREENALAVYWLTSVLNQSAAIRRDSSLREDYNTVINVETTAMVALQKTNDLFRFYQCHNVHGSLPLLDLAIGRDPLGKCTFFASSPQPNSGVPEARPVRQKKRLSLRDLQRAAENMRFMSMLLNSLIEEGTAYLMKYTNSSCSVDDENSFPSPCQVKCHYPEETERLTMCALQQEIQPQIETVLVNLEVFLEMNGKSLAPDESLSPTLSFHSKGQQWPINGSLSLSHTGSSIGPLCNPHLVDTGSIPDGKTAKHVCLVYILVKERNVAKECLTVRQCFLNMRSKSLDGNFEELAVR
ncbi:hypothetical protein LSH36_349g03019 [Paralvinella palmiformis]|uniref:Uncharacterized protein n=1 Tax=Paralvinella palmiformis TaxID=53620 RepID=A0AAD9JFM1_9ANNE|nr:hypothetical protein LSH36_349g03019 [Paralvinella palmiformis]